MSQEATNNDHNNNHDDQQQRSLQRQMLQWMGRPYLIRTGGLWTLTILIKISALLGNFSFLFLSSIQLVWKHLWVMSWNPTIGLMLGAILSSICLWCLPCSTGKMRHLYHNLSDLNPTKTTRGESLAMILSSWILLLCGAPLGPELALGAMSHLLVSLLQCLLPGSCRRRCRQKIRVQACWMQATMAAALSPLFPSCLSSALIIQELVLTARPHDISMEDVVQKQQHSSSLLSSTQHSTDAEGDNDSDALDSENGLDDQYVPFLASSSPLSPYHYYYADNNNNNNNQHRNTRFNNNHRNKVSSLDHDYMEMVFYSGVAATVAFLVYHTLIHYTHLESYCDWQRYRDAFDQLSDNDNNNSIGIDHRHYLLAIPLGVLGGIVASVIMMLTGGCHWIRRSCVFQSLPAGLPQWVGPVVCSALAGVIILLLTFLVPQPWMALDNGSNLMLYLLKHHTTMAVRNLLWIMCCRVTSLAIAIGFGGWFGGPIFPLASIGLCLGLLLSASIHSLAASLAVPCCMAAVVGSIIPVPFTIVITVSQLFNLQVGQVGPIFVATVISQSITGGLGIVRWYGNKVMGGTTNGHISDEDSEQDNDSQEQLLASDDEILQSVRSAIFARSPSSGA